ncbi:MAG: MarR family transcriptional regulator [Fusobacteria bacterium]|nr:MarR family transcriptional regulator [Fusobacteriota bacterium]
MENKDLAIKLIDTMRRFKKINMKNFNKCHLTSGQISMLHQIYYKNMKLEKPITVSQISKESQHTLSATTQIINNLDKEGYITRATDQDDRRIIRITLSEKGEKFILEHHKKLISYTNDIIETIGQEQAVIFIEIIEKIIKAKEEEDKKDD